MASAGQGAIEVELDMEVVGALAPHAQSNCIRGSKYDTGFE